jgi:hypothetical protein
VEIVPGVPQDRIDILRVAVQDREHHALRLLALVAGEVDAEREEVCPLVPAVDGPQLKARFGAWMIV